MYIRFKYLAPIPSDFESSKQVEGIQEYSNSEPHKAHVHSCYNSLQVYTLIKC